MAAMTNQGDPMNQKELNLRRIIRELDHAAEEHCAPLIEVMDAARVAAS
jgi:hypothetical protein